jgi:hypothetical protein
MGTATAPVTGSGSWQHKAGWACNSRAFFSPSGTLRNNEATHLADVHQTGCEAHRAKVVFTQRGRLGRLHNNQTPLERRRWRSDPKLLRAIDLPLVRP